MVLSFQEMCGLVDKKKYEDNNRKVCYERDEKKGERETKRKKSASQSPIPVNADSFPKGKIRRTPVLRATKPVPPNAKPKPKGKGMDYTPLPHFCQNLGR